MKLYYVLVLIINIVIVESRIVSANYNNDLERSSQCSDQNNLFLVPGVLAVGSNNRGCLSRFGVSVGGLARLQVLLPATGALSPGVDLPSGDGGCVDFAVPSSAQSKLDMIVKVSYAESNCTWQSSLTVRVLGTRVVYVQTERPRYRRGELLRARILQLRSDLTPPHTPIEEAWLEGPSGIWGEGTRIREWTKIRTRLGIAQLQYKIVDDAPTGQWSLRVRSSDGSEGSATFWVGDYQLPPFQLTVRHSPTVLLSSERLVWNVCARYPWGEAVEGLLVIRLRGAGGSEEDGVRTVVRARAPRACHRHAIAARRVGLEGKDPPHVLVADFSFQEDGTRVWQNTTVVSKIVEKPITLEFIAKHRSLIVPGLPYKLKVKTSRWDEKPASSVRVKVCRLPTNVQSDPRENWSDLWRNASDLNSKCYEAVTDARGIARISFTVSSNNTFKYYSFQASLKNDSSVNTALQLPVSLLNSAHAAFGAINAESGARTLIPLYINLKSVRKPITVHFVVVTRGGTLYRWGATTQCPTTMDEDRVHTAPKNSECVTQPHNNAQNAYNYNANDNYSNVSDVRFESSVLSIMLPIRITHQMCPDSHLIAYFYYNGELVSASKHLEVEECFPNKAELTWLTRQVTPKSMAFLQITTSTSALCALSALDATVTSPPSIRQFLQSSLKRMLSDQRNITAFDSSHCYSDLDNTISQETETMSRTLVYLSRAGVRAVGGDMSKIQCAAQLKAPALLVKGEEAEPRIDFAEAWLWRLVMVGANGTATVSARAPDAITRYSTSALCLSNSGLAIPQPVTIQVFRDFFLHADVPRQLRRGDTTILRYRLFNYLYQSLPVQIDVLSDSNLQVSVDSTVTACVKQRASISRRVVLRALAHGKTRVVVRAMVVTDPNLCGNYTGRNDTRLKDEIVMPIEVKPEGVPIEEYRSSLLCAEGSGDSSPSSISWKWSEARLIVPDTETWKVWAVGDVTGPLIANMDELVTLPRGCGEQNMARLATNLLALRQLTPRSTAAAVARSHVATGFSRQLQFAHPSGGFSAFGPADRFASSWLTAFTVRHMRRALKELGLPSAAVPTAVRRAEDWLAAQQMENGCFRSEGLVFHREMQGGLNEDSEIANVALTAYVITALIESGVTLPTHTLRNCLSCLRALPTNSQPKVYANALVTYAFMRIRIFEEDVVRRNEAGYLREKPAGLKQDEELKELVGLLKLAQRSGDFVWWETGNLATSIEATGYALLALSWCPTSLRGSCSTDARGASRWLGVHRSSSGGFLSTQDTLVALEGLISWSSLYASPPPDLNVTVNTAQSFQWAVITPTSRHVPVAFEVNPSDELKVRVEGQGCALVQATRSYNTFGSDDERGDNSLRVQMSVHTDGPFNCNSDRSSCYCAAVIETCAVWNDEFPRMALLEVRLPTGYYADATALYSQLQNPNTLLRRIETSSSNNKVTLYLSDNDHERVFARRGHYCLRLNVVGPQTRTKPAYATIIDYYIPHINHTQVFTIPEECPPRIAHNSPPEIGRDNIFTNARSLSDDSEIIISDTFTFEDIPEGIPLEDPLYDNLEEKEDQNYTNIQLTSNIGSDENEKVIVDYDNGDKINNSVISNESDRHNITQNVCKEQFNYKCAYEKARNVNNVEEFKRLNKSQNISNVSTTDIRNSFDLNLKTDSNEEGSDTELIGKDNNTEPSTNDGQNMKSNINYNSNDEIIEVNTKQNIREDVNNNVGTPLKNGDQFSNFHVINSVTDLEVPPGIEGPIPSVVLPPENFNSGLNKGPSQTLSTTDYTQNSRGYSFNPYTYINYFYPINQNYDINNSYPYRYAGSRY